MNRTTIYLLAFSIIILFGACNKRSVLNKNAICIDDTFVLNSVNKTTFSSGINRNSFTSKLPKGTKYVIINVQVDNKDSEAKFKSSLELLSSLSESGMDTNFKLAGGIAIVSMMPPSSGKYCDFFIFPDRQNFDNFMKQGTLQNWEGNWNSLEAPYKKLNTQSFNLVVDTKDSKDPNHIYLGFLNHNLTNACRIFLDIITIK